MELSVVPDVFAQDTQPGAQVLGGDLGYLWHARAGLTVSAGEQPPSPVPRLPPDRDEHRKRGGERIGNVDPDLMPHDPYVGTLVNRPDHRGEALDLAALGRQPPLLRPGDGCGNRPCLTVVAVRESKRERYPLPHIDVDPDPARLAWRRLVGGIIVEIIRLVASAAS
jgi:hypothetical protein